MPSTLSQIMPSITNDIAYEYDAIKSSEYEDLISKTLGNKKPSSNPCFEQIMGIPGAGKSTFAKLYQKEDAVFISFDKIMENIQQYQQDCKELGSIQSFKKWEMPARVIGYETLKRAIQKRINICFEHSGVIQSGLDLIKNLKNYNYTTQMNCITCDINEAYKRAEIREQQTKRHTPKEMIKQRAEKIEHFLIKYKDIADNITIFDTTNNQFEIKGTQLWKQRLKTFFGT